MNTLIAETLQSFNLDDYGPIVNRTLDLGEPLDPRRGNLVKVVTGMRRSGKSYRLFQELGRLLDMGIPKDHICYFNFEDDRLMPVTPETGEEVLETFYSLCPQALSDGAYLFFDELQEMQDWGRWLRRVVDTHKATIYVTGSSSKMLSDEVATEFRGRAIDFELLPYSFAEYLTATGVPVPQDPQGVDTEQRLVLQNSMLRYLDEGGFPATVGLPRPHAVALLQSYVHRVVSRDVVERHSVAKPRVAALFAQRMLGTNARPLSIRRIEADLRSAGLPTSRELLGNLLAYFEAAYLAFTVDGFSYSLRESTTSVPKVYAIDPGLALANGKANSNELGQRLEDAVYLELRRRSPGMRRDGICSYVTRGHGREVDFVTGDALESEVYDLTQVCADMDDETTRDRELRALWEALDETGRTEAVVVSLDGDERSYERGDRTILQIPAWKWFLQRDA